MCVKRSPALLLLVAATAAALLATSTAHAVQVQVTIQSLTQEGGVALSPFALSAHDGSVDNFNAGDAAMAGIEDVAELGDGTALLNGIASSAPSAFTTTATATMGGFGPGIFVPGSSGVVTLDLDPALHRFLSYASMVVPSNDAFLGNDSPTAIELFDASGAFAAADFTLTGAQIWDAGTEVNQLFGSTYVVGQTATDGDDEGGVVALADLSTEFSPYLGSDAPSGGSFSVAPTAGAPIVSFSFQVVPEPASWLLAIAAVCVMALLRSRR